MKIYAVNSGYASGSIGVRPARSLFDEYSANVPSPCTATDPVFVFSHNMDPTLYNLFYVPDMGKRFYNVVSVVYREGNMYEYHCHVNLLLTMIQSWKTHKDNGVFTGCLLERTNVSAYLSGTDVSEQYDARLYPINRRLYKLEKEQWVNRGDAGTGSGQFAIPAPHYISQCVTRVTSDNNRVFLIGFMDNTGGYKLAAMKETTFATVINNLCSTSLSGVTDTALAKYYGNPTECIRMCKVLPCRWGDMTSLANAQSLPAKTSLTLGYYTISGLTDCYAIPTQNPSMLMSFNQYLYYPRHPQYSSIPDKIINRAPHLMTYLSFPPFGTVEIDTTGLAYYPRTEGKHDMILTETIDVCTGEGTLYVSLWYGDTPPTDGTWITSAQPKMLAKANVCMDVPVIALVQNVGQVRSAQLGLAQLDTKRNMPDAQLSRFIASTVNSVGDAMQSLANSISSATANSKTVENGQWWNPFSNTSNYNRKVALGLSPSASERDAAVAASTPSINSKVNNAVSSFANGVKNAGVAMETTYNFAIETQQYKTQLSDAINYPQVSVTGNSTGSMTWMHPKFGRADLYLVYDEFVVSGFSSNDMGHECYKKIDNIIDLSQGTNVTPVNKVSLITQNVFVRNADCGQLTDSEKTELRSILNTGFCFYDNNDGW